MNRLSFIQASLAFCASPFVSLKKALSKKEPSFKFEIALTKKENGSIHAYFLDVNKNEHCAVLSPPWDACKDDIMPKERYRTCVRQFFDMLGQTLSNRAFPEHTMQFTMINGMSVPSGYPDSPYKNNA